MQTRPRVEITKSMTRGSEGFQRGGFETFHTCVNERGILGYGFSEILWPRNRNRPFGVVTGITTATLLLVHWIQCRDLCWWACAHYWCWTLASFMSISISNSCPCHFFLFFFFLPFPLFLSILSPPLILKFYPRLDFVGFFLPFSHFPFLLYVYFIFISIFSSWNFLLWQWMNQASITVSVYIYIYICKLLIFLCFTKCVFTGMYYIWKVWLYGNCSYICTWTASTFGCYIIPLFHKSH